MRILPRQMKRREPKLITQVQAANVLGVSLWHLNRVLRGHRHSRSLTRRYRALVLERRATLKEQSQLAVTA